MAGLKKNIAANIAGKFWSAAVVILLIPQYIKYLGIESYGLIGFYGTLLGSMSILDLGLSTTLNRELAKFKSEGKKVNEIRDLTFSLECIYCSIGLFIGIMVVVLSGFISKHWVNVENLHPSVVRQSVILMGIVIAFQWPISLYSGGLTGLEKQVFNNGITIFMSTLRAAGVLIVLIFVSKTLEAFFIWQVVVSFLYMLIMRWALWKKMPAFNQPKKFSRAQLKIVWRFAAGMTGISIVTFFIAQIDKILLSKILPLSQFGYYTLAYSVSSSLSLLTGPLSIAFFPRFADFFSAGKQDELKNLYHQACKLMAFFIFPFCFVLLFFMQDILRIWTKDPVTTLNAFPLAQVLVLGSLLNSLMIVPYNLLIATGWIRFTFIQNTIAAILMGPLIFFLTRIYGAMGAAYVWVILNFGYVVISQPLMHRKILKTELKIWYLKDTLLPMLPSLITVLVIKYLLQQFYPGLQVNLFVMGVIFCIVFGISMLNMPAARTFATAVLKGKYFRNGT